MDGRGSHVPPRSRTDRWAEGFCRHDPLRWPRRHDPRSVRRQDVRDCRRGCGLRRVHRHGASSAPAWDPNGLGEHSVVSQLRTLERYYDAGGTTFGAFAAGSLAGIGVVVPQLRPGIAQLAFLHVSAPFRATGIGSRLSDHLEEVGRAAGASEIVVSATPSENTVRFYLGRGFTPMGKPLTELFELEPDDVHLQEPL